MIYDYNKSKAIISELKLSNFRPFVNENDHLYKVMQLISDLKISVIPVLNHNDEYIGVITLPYLMSTLTNSTSFSEYGSIIILEINKIDYTLAQIAQIVESNDAKILSSYINSHYDSKKIEVTIKVNKQKIDSILQTFSRYEYNVISVFTDKEVMSEVKSRYRYNENLSITC